jgi:succinate-acetate transporter protein
MSIAPTSSRSSRPGLLLADGMGRVLSAFFGVFWASRVIVQLAYYDPATRRRDRGWDLFFLGVFLVMATVFTLAAIFG